MLPAGLAATVRDLSRLGVTDRLVGQTEVATVPIVQMDIRAVAVVREIQAVRQAAVDMRTKAVAAARVVARPTARQG